VVGISREKIKAQRSNPAGIKPPTEKRTAIEQNPLMLSVLRVNLPYAM
jgi:hypothetical protein